MRQQCLILFCKKEDTIVTYFYKFECRYYVILEWLNNNCKEPAEEITEVLMKYIKQNLK